MRHIPIENFKSDPDWEARAANATKELINCKTSNERKEYINSHATIWRELREQYIKAFGPKCWFTDVVELGSRLDVEHFRPKSKAINLDLTDFARGKAFECPEQERDGYWWLAFDRDNLRLCAQIPNREHKKCYFPLHATSKVAAYGKASWREENQVFLDPTVRSDAMLVIYGDDGGVHPRHGLSAWQKTRVELTNELFGLSSYPPLVEARQKVWQKCADLVADFLKLEQEGSDLLEPSAAIDEKKDAILRQLHEMTDPARSLASIATSYLEQSPHEFARWVASLQHKTK